MMANIGIQHSIPNTNSPMPMRVLRCQTAQARKVRMTEKTWLGCMLVSKERHARSDSAIPIVNNPEEYDINECRWKDGYLRTHTLMRNNQHGNCWHQESESVDLAQYALKLNIFFHNVELVLTQDQKNRVHKWKVPLYKIHNFEKAPGRRPYVLNLHSGGEEYIIDIDGRTCS